MLTRLKFSNYLRKIFPSFIKNKIRRRFLRIVKLEEIKEAKLIKTINFIQESVPTPEINKVKLPSDFPNHLKASNYLPPNAKLICLKNILYYPKFNILLTKNREIIGDSLNAERDRIYNYINYLEFYQVPKKLKGCFSLMRSVYNDYYHTLIDNVPRLFLLNQKELEKYLKISLLFPNTPSEIEKFYLERFLPKNFQIEVVDPENLYLLEEVIFPDFIAQYQCGFLPVSYQKFFNHKVLPKYPRKKENMIYIARAFDSKNLVEKLKGIELKGKPLNNFGKKRLKRLILNENELVGTLKNYGFKKYILEDMTIENQIELFYNAAYVVAAHGAGLSNIVFSENIGVLELFSSQFFMPHYYYLSKSLGHTYKHLCSNEDHWQNDFKVNIPKLEKVLSRELELIN